MEINQFIEKLSDVMDVNVSALTPDTEFHKLEEWSSITALTTLVMIEEEYGVVISGKHMRETNTIQELFALVTSALSSH